MRNNVVHGYLKKVYEIESFLYTQRLLKKEIEKKLNYVLSWRPQEMKDLRPRDYESARKSGWISVVIWILCTVFMGWVGVKIAETGLHDSCLHCFEHGFGDWWDNMNGIIKGLLVIPLAIIVLGLALIFWFRPVAAVVVGYFGGIILHGIIMFFVHCNEDNNYARQYAEEMKIENQGIEQANHAQQMLVDKRVFALNEELRIINEEIKRAEEILKQYYAKDIIYQKYRNFVAVSSFYEYFESGRCSELVGHEGAYNIFETEIRQNLIIRQLEEVITQLDRIEENQYMIYSAITESNAALKRFATQVNQSLEKLGHSMDSLNDNMQIVGYNTRIAAQNTEFMKWLSVFEMERAARD